MYDHWDYAMVLEKQNNVPKHHCVWGPWEKFGFLSANHRDAVAGDFDMDQLSTLWAPSWSQAAWWDFFMLWCNHSQNVTHGDFPGGPVVKSLPANVVDMG